MVIRFYNNLLSQASRRMATGLVTVGLLLLGFGMLIIALPELFAFLAALVFFMAGLGCAVSGIKIYWAQRRIDRMASHPSEPMRHNVRIHTTHFEDF
jgi:hypothetical protein